MSPAAIVDRLRRTDPRVVDTAFAVLLTGLSLVAQWLSTDAGVEERRDPVAYALLVAMALPLALRRRHPVAVLGVVGLATVAYAIRGPSQGSGLGVLIALYSVAVHADRRTSRLVLGGTLAVILAAYGAAYVVQPAGGLLGYASDVVVILLSFGVAWSLGNLVRVREATLRDLRERNAELEAEREENARLAVEAERARIARELHDAVAHNLSVMVVQATAARRRLASPAAAGSEDDVREALATIESTGRDSLDDLRRVVGALRPAGDEAYQPAPSLANVEGLVAAVRRAGLAVDVVVEGDPRPLPQGVDLSGYRIVQEALTNTLKHASADGARVRLRYAPDALEVEVTDDGRGAVARLPEPAHHGYGLVGMRERVAMLGGELRVGPRRGGGFEVHARLPLGAPR